ncbi:uncharacterized protein Z519_01874 [Cladophialophora bantiana CBS 173.52]|uniref:FAD-binding domain-containing protein n=1 Tax=Cladophialophora bantiana (strain ATCC 10958 / CBS 173.52 / CDC B-1940 / NIH 8579) TaxID=1442370 RepID=A0A0D2I4T8_CLAB1|nr:uncharacterized protein Z519_01874 [Cladophialophora bantiana CBS 173.52]KIW98290.1 hypothetical protein Z519_01874 [Cladophialophora bantiana CBS 173.52]
MNRKQNATQQPFNVVVVGAGIGGLAAAVSCLRGGCEVTILEKAPEISPIGAGIQIPPNAARVVQHFGLEQKLRDAGAVQINANHLKRYKDGKILCSRIGGEKMVRDFNGPWFVIHRADYHGVLLDEAVRLGAKLRLNAEAVDIKASMENPHVVLQTGEIVHADVIIGADGLWSAIRDIVLGHSSPPEPTGDLAYRGTFSRAQLEAFQDPQIEELINSRCTYNWMGPDRHSVFYPVKNGTAFNLVLMLVRPDNLPPGSRTEAGDIGEMRMTYQGWDPVLAKIISCHNSVLKWKLCHHEELRTWVKDNIVLIGDASHPTLPYQAQGAAMAAEDGLVLGLLLGRLQASDRIPGQEKRACINSVLRLFESLRKKRTTVNVKGAVANRYMYHMHDGPEQEARDRELSEVDWQKPSRWGWADMNYQRKMLGFDSVADTNRAFEVWLSEQEK